MSIKIVTLLVSGQMTLAPRYECQDTPPGTAGRGPFEGNNFRKIFLDWSDNLVKSTSRSYNLTMVEANTTAAEVVPKVNTPAQGSKPPQKKRKKNAPDKPQPEWMFPPDEENPVLNPKPKSDTQVIKDQKEREAAIEFLHYKSVSAPKKPAPPGLLLTLVGGFLSSYGFDGASRIYTSQCSARKKLGAWDHELGVKLPKGMPGLEKIFKDWYRGYEQTRQEETSSSSDEGSDSETQKPGKSKKRSTANKIVETKAEQTSSSGSSDGSSEDSESAFETPKMSNGPKAVKKSTKTADIPASSSSSTSDSEAEQKPSIGAKKIETKAKKAISSPGSSSSSSSDSDADDEKETPGAKVSPSKPTVNGLVDKLKRRADSTASSSSDSNSGSSSSDEPPAKKPNAESVKGATKIVAPTSASKSTLKSNIPTSTTSANKSPPSSSESSSSESDSSGESLAKKPLSASSSKDNSSSSDSEIPASTKLTQASTAADANLSSDSGRPTDSSATLAAASPTKPSTSITSTSSSDSSAPCEPAKSEKKSDVSQKRKRSPSPHSVRANMPPTKVKKNKDAPFQRVPKDTKIDPKLASNKYVSYDYADRAHQDLSVTKGKGFTKEKNKKKRGSYRGGMIDVDGRKGIKFDN